MTEQQPEGFLLRLLGGHCGLAVTFWAFGLGVGIAQALLVGPVVRDSEGWPVFTTVGVSVVFHILVWVAIWKAAESLRGPAGVVRARQNRRGVVDRQRSGGGEPCPGRTGAARGGRVRKSPDCDCH